MFLPNAQKHYCNIQRSAQNSAQNGELIHDFDELNFLGQGENLGMQWHSTDSPPVNYTHTINAWYMDEIDLYDFSNPGFSAETSHFSQIVWKGTTSFCMRHAFSENGLEVYYAARYFERGNHINKFSENVLPLKIAVDEEHTENFDDVSVDFLGMVALSLLKKSEIWFRDHYIRS